MNYFEEFCQTFKPLLTAKEYKVNQYSRWEGFEIIAKELFNKKRPVNIIETGTLRAENDWLGYGHSTLIWDWIANKIGGIINSVDIDEEAIKLASSKTKHINFVHCDSFIYLRHVNASKLDLLYLDSYNWSRELHISSCLHHMGELAAVYDKLPKGCLIAVDDRHTNELGKHVLVDKFFDSIVKTIPLIKCHMIIWEKP